MKVSFYESCKVCCKKLVETIVLEAFYKSFVARCPKELSIHTIGWNLK